MADPSTGRKFGGPDMPNEDELADALLEAAANELKCSCKWQLMDTGSQFHARIIKDDPYCAVHHPKH